MHIPILNLDVMDHDDVKALKAAATAAGITIVDAGKGEIASLWEQVKAKYPVIVTQIEAGIKDAENSSLSGGEKAVKVAMDILPYLPEAVNELSDVKSFAVHAVTETFAALKNAVGSVLKDVAAKL